MTFRRVKRQSPKRLGRRTSIYCPVCERAIYTTGGNPVEMLLDHFVVCHRTLVKPPEDWCEDWRAYSFGRGCCPCGAQFAYTFASSASQNKDSLFEHWEDMVRKHASVSRHLRPYLFLQKLAEQ